MTRISKPRRFAAAFRAVLAATYVTFCKAARINFEAPWRPRRRNAC